jgi:Flp pilus assembly protein TadD
MKHISYPLLRLPLAVLPVALVLAACQPSVENRLLHESGLKMEDPKYFPSDDFVRMGKVHFRHGDYGLAATNYRKAVEVTPRDSEAWLGLAASYDQLRRFDLADQAYKRAESLGRNNPIILNNIGYSQMLRGNIPEARRLLLKAHELDPDNPYIANNITLLGESGRTVKRVSL